MKFCYASESLWQEYFSFAIVRNPYDRVESFYKYLGYSGAVNFDRFIHVCLPEILQSDMGWFVKPQVSYIVDDQNRLAVDEVIKLEQLNQELPRLLARVGINIAEIPHVNRSQGYDKGGALHRLRMLRRGIFEPATRIENHANWTGKTRQMVDSLYEADFQTFSYEFFQS